jgi:hypothetical protein
MTARNVQSIHPRGQYRLTASAKIFTRFKKIDLAQLLFYVKGADTLINQSTLMSDIVVQTTDKIENLHREDLVNSV